MSEIFIDSEILKKQELNLEDVVSLLNIDNKSENFYKLIAKANDYSRKTFKKAYIFAQIGINSNPCSGNCKFCSMAKDNYLFSEIYEKSEEEILSIVKNISNKISDLFLMTTADYSKDKFLKIAKAVRRNLNKNVNLIANIGDFDYNYALKLKEVGVYGCYHIKRINEGYDTDILESVRLNTIFAIQKADLKLYYCIEPIGVEHNYRQIAKEIMLAKSLNIDVMAVMKRISVKGTHFENYKEISLLELTKICAVTLLAVKPKLSMNAHEPNYMSLLGGVNQLYAEYGFNPRDEKENTENNRGFDLTKVIKMLDDNEWTV